MTASPGGFYIVQNAHTGSVKIGVGAGRDRLHGLQTGNEHELRLIAERPEWGLLEETAAHAKFARFRIRGEWFRYEEPVAAFAKSLNPDAPGARTVAGPRFPEHVTGLPRGIAWRLTRAGFKTVAQLAAKRLCDLARTRGIGPKAIEAIKAAIAVGGLAPTRCADAACRACTA